MKNKSNVWRLIAVIGIAAFAAACSDGELSLGNNLDITPPAPVVLNFKADPPQVEVGGSTTLYWEVEEADSIEIAAAPEGLLQFHTESEELSGSVLVEDITETTDFILTASKTVMIVAPADGAEGDVNEPPVAFVINKAGQIEIPGEPPTPSTSPVKSSTQSTITVTVAAPAEECSANITSDAGAEPLTAGESTAIRWTATPGTAQVAVTASDSTPVVAAADCSAMTGAAEGYAAIGCASVTPTATITYTIKVTCPDGQEKSGAVRIQVAEANVTADILTNGVKNASVTDLTKPVEVKWTASPANAKVKITATPAAVCEPALPDNVESAEGTASCMITGNTTFAIEATVGDETKPDNANVVLQQVTNVALGIAAGPWAFVSEEVEIEITAPSAAVASSIQSVKVGDKTFTGADLAVAQKVRVRVPDVQGIPVYVLRVGATEPEVQKPKPEQKIVELANHQFFHNTNGELGAPLPVTRVTVDPNDASKFYYGVKREDFGEISLYRLNNFENSKEFAIDIETPLKTAYDFQDLWQNNKFFAEDVKTYPVGAVAVREGKPEWIFAATTGVMMYSNDGGDTWNRLEAIIYPRGDEYPGEHPTCAGKKQTGSTNAKSSTSIAALGQVCDMIAREDGRLIVAYDRGIATLDNVEDFVSDPKVELWIGLPVNGGDQSGYVNGPVANDLEQAGTKIFAATSSGVYVNEAGDGKSWAQFAGGALDGTKAVYALAFDAKSNKIFAGADDGVYVGDVASANWAKTEGTLEGPILSLAVDPAYDQKKTGPVVLAGTATGLAVTRDGGKFWSVLNSIVATDLGEVRSVAIAAVVNGSEVTYKISAGGNGSAAGSVAVGIVDTPTPADEDEETGETSEETGGDETGGEDGEVTDEETPGGGIGGGVEPAALSFKPLHTIMTTLSSLFTR